MGRGAWGPETARADPPALSGQLVEPHGASVLLYLPGLALANLAHVGELKQARVADMERMTDSALTDVCRQAV